MVAGGREKLESGMSGVQVGSGRFGRGLSSEGWVIKGMQGVGQRLCRLPLLVGSPASW